MGAAVIASVDAAPVFEPAEHYLDFMTLFIKFGIVRDKYFAV